MSTADSKLASPNWRLDWPTSSGRRFATAKLKSAPSDFFVDELLEHPDPMGGEHLCIRLEKTGDNTDYVARELARLAECRHQDVGFCGLKDRHAVTRQWFSLYRPGQESEDEALALRIAERWPVIERNRRPRKLRRGEHRGNRFEILLRQVDGDAEAINQALTELSSHGCPNYFGPQRFGHNGGNLDQAVQMDPASAMSRPRSGRKRRGRHSGAGSQDAKNVLYFSAARSWLFNEVLAHRVEAGNWQERMDGEPGLPGFPEVEATGPMWGDGGTEAVSKLGDLERQVVAERPDMAAVFSTTRMKPERRRLVLMPDELRWKWLETDQLWLSFGLLPGQYATTLLSNVFEIE